MTGSEIIPDVERRYQELNRDAERGGYHLNPDLSMTKGLIEGLLINKERYGYEACPCRLAFGTIEDDRDVICPCDYRDPDLSEFGACYCGLYLTGEKIADGTGAPAIPERRPSRSERKAKQMPGSGQEKTLPYPVWRCKVCGYLAARDAPPEVCPICKAKKDRFEIFIS
ncbi:ferredoxin-thioredoxin reductase catalytic domain-containing protein [Methanospirillum lacunae]|uniref:ferredoxin:thioredoxin reductase n=1 Tax=Methanospirillum lacunae TaxID=668570 RepID=A0A2V2N1Y4_9EURY|nr:ferredoxin-thioredoxin reductase catalytic domain-containing protein [Methanospirillum lacunae]PWR74122.1 ferredoxin:glutaredoxin reductase [Methanospirillum lacunae]